MLLILYKYTIYVDKFCRYMHTDNSIEYKQCRVMQILDREIQAL